MLKTKKRISKAIIYDCEVEFDFATYRWGVCENGKMTYFTFFRNAMRYFNQLIAKQEKEEAIK